MNEIGQTIRAKHLVITTPVAYQYASFNISSSDTGTQPYAGNIIFLP